MSKTYILGGCRTYIGKKGRAFRKIPVEDLGAAVISRLCQDHLCENGTLLHTPDMLIAGNAVGGGGNIARLAGLKADPICQVPSMTIDLQCASGLSAVLTADAFIKAGKVDLVLAGGMESVSTQPKRLRSANHPLYDEENPAYSAADFSPDAFGDLVMIEGAERTAEEYGVTREELDEVCLQSHKRAADARDRNLLLGVIEPAFDSVRDEEIREKMSPELLARMKPVLPQGKYIHPANAASEADGAAFLLLCSDRFLALSGIRPIAEILSAAQISADPNFSPATAIPSLEEAVRAAGHSMENMDALEMNEPFAVISALFARKYPELLDRYNRFGGALAYGHPFGASGAVLLIHLLESLRLGNGAYGACSVPAAGGVGVGLVLRSLTNLPHCGL
ncbi:MAG: thiolase family protein [Clostridiales Family XIII bacterium]|jgi:acetyl-CoA C-acetyltransferase|nr:thiolase family protein [Clostridiales Family XIII bacterium]